VRPARTLSRAGTPLSGFSSLVTDLAIGLGTACPGVFPLHGAPPCSSQSATSLPLAGRPLTGFHRLPRTMASTSRSSSPRRCSRSLGVTLARARSPLQVPLLWARSSVPTPVARRSTRDVDVSILAERGSDALAFGVFEARGAASPSPADRPTRGSEPSSACASASFFLRKEKKNQLCCPT
jgi:hypothetical protein